MNLRLEKDKSYDMNRHSCRWWDEGLGIGRDLSVPTDSGVALEIIVPKETSFNPFKLQKKTEAHK